MIYLQQDFDLDPASPATRDRFIDLAQGSLVPTQESLGGRLVGAWFNNEEWFSRITHVTEFESLAAFDDTRTKARGDESWRSCQRELEAIAPARRDTLLEPLGAIPSSKLAECIAAAANEAQDVYTFAILEVRPGQMERFTEMLAGAGAGLPIVASWRPVAGNPNEVIDLWRGDVGRTPYRPANDAINAFFEPLREIAPRERMVRLHALPYSPLR